VAQIAAVRHRGFCRGLFLTNSIGYDSWPIPSIKAMSAAGPLLRHLPDAMTRQIVHTLMIRGHDNPARGDESLDLHWSHYAAHGGAEALIRQVEALDVRDTTAIADQLPGLGIPARLVWGTADPFQKIEYGERLAAALHAPLRRIEGGLHFTPEDHAEIVAQEINLLLAEVDRSDMEMSASAPSSSTLSG
jgi:pimeloyl-ACP methyl ester carboxylesterase